MLNMTTLAERLQSCLDDLGIKGAELARRIAVSKATVSLWLNGTTKQIDGDNLMKAALALGVEPRWLQGGQGPRKRQSGTTTAAGRAPELVPILEWQTAHLYADPEIKGAASERLYSTIHLENGFYLRAENESHYGNRDYPANKGSFFLIDPDASIDAYRAAGQPVVAVVRTKDGDNLLRKLVQEGSRTYLHPLNPAYPPEPMPDGAQLVGLVAGLVWHSPALKI